MTNDHVVHVLDRFMATFMAVAYIWKMSALYFYGRPTTFFAQLVSFTFALFAFMNSQDAQETRDVNGFVFWHCLSPYFNLCLLRHVMLMFLGNAMSSLSQGNKKKSFPSFWSYTPLISIYLF